jgi:hypothetical protein
MTDFCNCAEGFLTEFTKTPDGGPDVEERYRIPLEALEKHDCHYIMLRNSLVPAAEDWANSVDGKYPPKEEGELYQKWVREWNRTFHHEMERLVRLHGISRLKKS